MVKKYRYNLFMRVSISGWFDEKGNVTLKVLALFILKTLFIFFIESVCVYNIKMHTGQLSMRNICFYDVHSDLKIVFKNCYLIYWMHAEKYWKFIQLRISVGKPDDVTDRGEWINPQSWCQRPEAAVLCCTSRMCLYIQSLSSTVHACNARFKCAKVSYCSKYSHVLTSARVSIYPISRDIFPCLARERVLCDQENLNTEKKIRSAHSSELSSLDNGLSWWQRGRENFS